MPPKKKSADASRLGFVDDTRGVAVVLMIFWHTVDAWLNPALKEGLRFQLMRSTGGLAAPMFVFLAGAGAALKFAADAERGKPRSGTIRELTCRGLEVVVAGYSLRVFLWIVDGGALTNIGLIPAYVPLAAGLATLYVALGRIASRAANGTRLLAIGAVLWGIGWWLTALLRPEQLMRLQRVDVLQAIGASLVIIAWTEPLFRYVKRPYIGLLLGLAVTSVSGFVERSLPGVLPPGAAAYLGRWDGELGTLMARFPLFPWLGYALCGTTIGMIWLRGVRAGRTTATVVTLACVGAVVGFLTRDGSPWAFAFIEEFPELSRTVRSLQKLGFGLALSGLSYVITQRLGRFPLRTLGVTSLFVYWVHIELVYGLIARPLKQALGFTEWAVAFVLLTLFMAAAAEARVRVPIALGNRRRHTARSPRNP